MTRRNLLIPVGVAGFVILAVIGLPFFVATLIAAAAAGAITGAVLAVGVVLYIVFIVMFAAYMLYGFVRFCQGRNSSIWEFMAIIAGFVFVSSYEWIVARGKQLHATLTAEKAS